MTDPKPGQTDRITGDPHVDEAALNRGHRPRIVDGEVQGSGAGAGGSGAAEDHDADNKGGDGSGESPRGPSASGIPIDPNAPDRRPKDTLR